MKATMQSLISKKMHYDMIATVSMTLEMKRLRNSLVLVLMMTLMILIIYSRDLFA